MYAVVILYVFTEKSLMLNDSDFSSSCHKKGKSILEEEGRTRSSKHWSIWLRKYGGEIIHHICDDNGSNFVIILKFVPFRNRALLSSGTNVALLYDAQ